MWRRWNEVFNQKLGYAERNYVSELMTAQRFGRTSSLSPTKTPIVSPTPPRGCSRPLTLPNRQRDH
ncbi:MAG: hypothetical protein R2873_27400 [Caldilineaceae bacterium]